MWVDRCHIVLCIKLTVWFNYFGWIYRIDFWGGCFTFQQSSYREYLKLKTRFEALQRTQRYISSPLSFSSTFCFTINIHVEKSIWLLPNLDQQYIIDRRVIQYILIVFVFTLCCHVIMYYITKLYVFVVCISTLLSRGIC